MEPWVNLYFALAPLPPANGAVCGGCMVSWVCIGGGEGHICPIGCEWQGTPLAIAGQQVSAYPKCCPSVGQWGLNVGYVEGQARRQQAGLPTHEFQSHLWGAIAQRYLATHTLTLSSGGGSWGRETGGAAAQPPATAGQ